MPKHGFTHIQTRLTNMGLANQMPFLHEAWGVSWERIQGRRSQPSGGYCHSHTDVVAAGFVSKHGPPRIYHLRVLWNEEATGNP